MFGKLIDKQKEKILEQASAELTELLLDTETLEHVEVLVEDYIAFTDKRLIFMDAAFFSNKKNLVSIPFSKITSVGLSKGGFMSFTQEIGIAVGSAKHEIKIMDEKSTMGVYNRICEKII